MIRSNAARKDLNEKGLAELFSSAIGADVTEFAMLGHGNAVFVTAEKAVKRALAKTHHHDEAFVSARSDRSAWNLLEGVASSFSSRKIKMIDDRESARLKRLYGCLAKLGWASGQ
jgi:hypothetical protein